MKKTTRRALFLSFASMFLCFTMLLGTTYAWFTDSVESGVNQIVAGNLDVELTHTNNVVTDEDVKEKTNLFKLAGDQKWEPGAMVWENFTVKNVGDLALKYQLTLDATPVGSKDLTKVLKVAVVEGGVLSTDTRETLKEKTYTALETFSLTGEMTAGAADVTYGVVIYWEPSDADNEYNMNNANKGNVLSVDIKVNLFATQLEAESDSFGNDYDEDAVYADHYVATAEELQEALDEGGTVALMNDIDLNAVTTYSTASCNTLVIKKGNDATINLNGFNIVAASTKDSGNQMAIQVKGNLTIEGEGTISMIHTGANMEWNNLSAVVSVEGGTLTLGEGVTLIHNGGTDMAYAVDVNSTLGATTLNVNGANLCSSYVGVRIFNNHKTAKGTVNYNSGVIQGNKNGYDIWAQQMNCPAENAVVNIAKEIEYTTEDKSGVMYYIGASSLATESEDVSNALAKDEDVVFVGDITVTGVAQLPDRNSYVEAYGNKVGFAQYGGVVDGNGHTLTDEEGDRSYLIVTHGGTIKNLTIKSGARGIVTYAPTENVYLDNVVVDGAGYALNSTEHGAVDMFVTNSTINGWTSLAGFKSVNFINCKLGENSLKYWQGMGYNQDYDRLFRVYSATTFDKCEFEQGYYLDMSVGGTATLTGCTVNGVELTADNYADYITIKIPSGKTLADCVTFQ